MSEKKRIDRRNFLAGSGVAFTTGAIIGTQTNEAKPSDRYASTPVLDTVDVLIVGSGPAGIGAALAVQRQGVKCLLIESYSFFGGSAVWGLGKPMEEMLLDGKPRSVIHEDVIKHLTKLGNQAARIEGSHVYPNVHFLKAALVDALDAVGCPYYVHVQAVYAVVEGNRVTGVIVSTKQGLMRVNAKVVIDCTGDASIACFAGGTTIEDGGGALMFLSAAYIDVDLAATKPNDINKAFNRSRTKYPLLPKTVQGLKQVANGTFGMMDHSGMRGLGSYDPLDPKQRSHAECQSRRQIVQMEHAMRASSTPTLMDIDICEGAPQLNVSVPRRVKGLYTLTSQDLSSGTVFDDTIALRYERDTYCGIPYRTLIPETLDGILVAGSGLSAIHDAESTIAGNCMATGHAAGLAAVLSVKEKIKPRALEVTQLQRVLREEGVELDINIS